MPLWGRAPAVTALILLLALTTGCAITRPAFAVTTEDIGSVFKAAATTLAFAHEGKITERYARASFVTYERKLRGVDKRLLAVAEASSPATISRLLALAQSAQEVVAEPCLDDTCDWQSQVQTLVEASEAFRRASER